MNLDKINCKKIFQKAYEKRYTWNEDFNGYKGRCIFLIDNHRYEGEFVLGKNFKPDIKKINDNKIVKLIGSQLFEVCIHRLKREFESIHSENNFNFLRSSDMGIEMKVSGKNDGDKYRVKDECINMVYRKIHGNIIEIFVDEFLETEIGFLSKKYTSQQIDPNTLKPNSPKLEYEDQFINIGNNNIWILNSRTIKYLNKKQKEEIQKFVFEDICLLS